MSAEGIDEAVDRFAQGMKFKLRLPKNLAKPSWRTMSDWEIMDYIWQETEELREAILEARTARTTLVQIGGMRSVDVLRYMKAFQHVIEETWDVANFGAFADDMDRVGRRMALPPNVMPTVIE